MFRFSFYFNAISVFITLIEGKSLKTDDNILEDNQEVPWQNLWFPHPSNYRNDVKPRQNFSEENFSKNITPDYHGFWFPHPPNYHSDNIAKKGDVKIDDKKEKFECDNGNHGLNVDFDPQDKRHSFNYLCIANKSDYNPNLNTSALLTEYIVPAAYEPPVKCLNESIEYIEPIPTFGAYRPLAPTFGSYKFLPPQRWLHSLADGAIVLLYHPCANPGEIKKLKKILSGCLYRHIITPSQLLTPQYPLALLAWGKSLHMSVVDEVMAVTFINDNAKIGFREKGKKFKISSKLYDAGLLAEAHLITDEQDTEICGYIKMR